MKLARLRERQAVVLQSLKTKVRASLPAKYQVPAKFWYGRLRGDVEPEMSLLPLLVEAGDHVVDIGGNRGIYAYRLKKLGARVDVFEPNPDCAAILETWASDKLGVTINTIALSSRSGDARLFIPVDENGVEHDSSASIEPFQGDRAREKIVATRSLDSYGFSDVRFIKIDTEGHEASVLTGAMETLKTCAPALIVEIEQRHNSRPIDAIFGSITQLGYTGYFMYKGDILPLNTFDVARHQPAANLGSRDAPYCNNFIFLHERRVARGEYVEFAKRARHK